MEDYSHLDKKTQSRVARRLAKGMPAFSKNQLKNQSRLEEAAKQEALEWDLLMLASVDKHIRY